MAKREPSIDSHATDIDYIKERLSAIEAKLETKYVSHETFDLVIKQITDMISSNRKTQEDADSRIIRTAMFFATPIYGAVIALLIKIFTQ